LGLFLQRGKLFVEEGFFTLTVKNIMASNNRSARILSQAFGGAPVATEAEDRSGLTTFSIHGLEGNWTLRGIWAGEGWPADVERVLDSFSPAALPRDLVVLAGSFSPGAIKALTARDANWADERGNAHIRGVGLLIDRLAAPKRPEAHNFSWSPSALAVAEALLAADWPEGISTGDLARIVGWSPGQVSQVLQTFDRKGWTVKYGPQRGPRARRELSDPDALLQAWASELASEEQEARLTHRTLRSPLAFLSEELGPRLSEEVRWAVGGWAAAHELAPLSTAVPSLQIYVQEGDFGEALDRVVREAGLNDVAEGGRVAFIPAPASVLALSRRLGGLPAVSAPRVYADLLSFGGRGLDAARHLKEEVLDAPREVAEKSRPPQGLVDWELSCRRRAHELSQRQFGTDPYAPGSWSASYRVLDLGEHVDARTFAGVMREVAGRETGWPAWWAPAGGDNRPRPVDGEIECWLRDMVPAQPSHADYWRADPRGRLCLIRPYQEDSELGVAPHTALDLILPIWRTGECLLHAERLARRLEGETIQLMMRWLGLRSRSLQGLLGGRRIAGRYEAGEDEVVTFVHTTARDIGADLVKPVRELVKPLYEAFDFFEPPVGIYEEELKKMRAGDFGAD